MHNFRIITPSNSPIPESLLPSPAPCTDGQLRLAGGNVANEGRVEICLNNEWGTICDDNWSTSDANVVCSALGFSDSSKFIFQDYICLITNESVFAQMLWHLAVPTLVLETMTSCWTMSAALGQSLPSWTAILIPLSAVNMATMRMLE